MYTNRPLIIQFQDKIVSKLSMTLRIRLLMNMISSYCIFLLFQNRYCAAFDFDPADDVTCVTHTLLTVDQIVRAPGVVHYRRVKCQDITTTQTSPAGRVSRNSWRIGISKHKCTNNFMLSVRKAFKNDKSFLEKELCKITVERIFSKQFSTNNTFLLIN